MANGGGFGMGGDMSDIFEAMFGGGFGNVQFGGMGGVDMGDLDLEGMEDTGGMGKRAKGGGKKRRPDAPEEGEDICAEVVVLALKLFSNSHSERVLI